MVSINFVSSFLLVVKTLTPMSSRRNKASLRYCSNSGALNLLTYGLAPLTLFSVSIFPDSFAFSINIDSK